MQAPYMNCDTPTPQQWEELARRLREPFDPNEVDFRVQGRANEQTGRGQVVAYIDARVVQDRLDAIVGAGNWSFDWTPLVIDNGEVMVSKGTLTIHGVSKSDAGSASNFEQSLGAVSHCFKRAAVHWGIGRYLYSLPATWVQVEKGGRISEAVLRELRSKLPRPGQAGSSEEMDEGERVVDSPVDRRRRPAPMPQANIVRETSAPAAVAPAPSVTPAVAPAAAPRPAASAEPPASEQQLVSIRKLCAALGKPEPEPGLTYNGARQLITQLSGEYQQKRRAS
jgi:hypothetical protein